MINDVGLATALRAPVQGRSKASYERMLEAAEALLVARGNDEFTLQEVSKQGKVSIGSIYNRFESKDALLHAVQLRVLERLDKIISERIAAARMGQATLPPLVRSLVEALAETFREFGPQMRPLMARASTDPLVASVGKASYKGTADAIKEALLEHRGEMRVKDPEQAVDSTFRIVYAALARYLGFGTVSTSAWEGDWAVLKQDLARMVAAFLMSDPLM